VAARARSAVPAADPRRRTEWICEHLPLPGTWSPGPSPRTSRSVRAPRGHPEIGAALRRIFQAIGAALCEAAFTVFVRSIAMVIGPTPPGTGEIAEAFSFTASKSTSPTTR